MQFLELSDMRTDTLRGICEAKILQPFRRRPPIVSLHNVQIHMHPYSNPSEPQWHKIVCFFALFRSRSQKMSPSLARLQVNLCQKLCGYITVNMLALVAGSWLLKWLINKPTVWPYKVLQPKTLEPLKLSLQIRLAKLPAQHHLMCKVPLNSDFT